MDQVRRQTVAGGQGNHLSHRFGEPQNRGATGGDSQDGLLVADQTKVEQGFGSDTLGGLNQDRDAAADDNETPAPQFRNGAVDGEQGNRLPGGGHRNQLEGIFVHDLII